MKLRILVASAVIALAGGVANAASVTFDGGPPGGAGYTEAGFVFDDVRIVNSNECQGSGSGKPCAALNNNEMSTMTKVGGGNFTVTSIWFGLLGNGTGNYFSMMTDKGTLTFPESTWPNNTGTGHSVSLLGNMLFENISYVKFTSAGGGNARFDDIGIANGTTPPNEVPLPAAGWMLLAALGGLAVARRRS